MSDPNGQTGRLARFITTLTFEAIPDRLLDLGRIPILDAPGCGLSGSLSEGAVAACLHRVSVNSEPLGR
jgi:hypothetical protein